MGFDNGKKETIEEHGGIIFLVDYEKNDRWQYKNKNPLKNLFKTTLMSVQIVGDKTKSKLIWIL